MSSDYLAWTWRWVRQGGFWLLSAYLLGACSLDVAGGGTGVEERSVPTESTGNANGEDADADEGAPDDEVDPAPQTPPPPPGNPAYPTGPDGADDVDAPSADAGADDEVDDNSGPGSGDETDDNSGPGNGEADASADEEEEEADDDLIDEVVDGL